MGDSCITDLLNQGINLCNTLLRLAQLLTLGGKLLLLVLEGLGGAAEIHRIAAVFLLG